MDKSLTEMVFVIDRSGSMKGLEKETIDGFNNMMENQKKQKGDALVTLVLFDGCVNELYVQRRIEKVEKLSEKQYFVRGCTALLDAIGSSIEGVCERRICKKESEIPSKTIFVIITDGFENSSNFYSLKETKQLINKAKESNFEFMFLGADMKGVREAVSWGINPTNVVKYKNDVKGIQINFKALDKVITKYRKQPGNKVFANTNWAESITKNDRKRNHGSIFK